ncbi:MAG: hypothetical protein WDM90_22205 [Ferruginibacter sp.]
MKKMFLFFALMATGVVFKADAQIKLSVNLNLQPDWGPTGYDHADYYYFPDNDIYYDISGKRFVYQNKGKWAFATTLPAKYRSTDLYHSYKVVLNERKPYLHNDQNRVKYASFRGRKDQPVRRDNHDNRNGRKNNNGHNKKGKH